MFICKCSCTRDFAAWGRFNTAGRRIPWGISQLDQNSATQWFDASADLIVLWGILGEIHHVFLDIVTQCVFFGTGQHALSRNERVNCHFSWSKDSPGTR